MSTYNVELYSDTGYKFLVPDLYGYMFSHYQDFTLPVKRWDNSVFYTYTPPSPCDIVVFSRVIGRVGGGVCPTIAYNKSGNSFNFNYTFDYKDSNPGHSVTVRVYFFTSLEMKVDNSQYGLQVFDSSGRSVWNSSSLPLRLQRINWGFNDGWSVDLGYPPATLCTRLAVQGVQVQPIPTVSNIYISMLSGMGEGNILKIGSCLQLVLPGYSGFRENNNPEILFINASLYE